MEEILLDTTPYELRGCAFLAGASAHEELPEAMQPQC
jgi:hypothetical protein